jgi:hypothetical protein
MKIYQIYYDNSQLGAIDYIPYFNKNCTVYFENDVIKQLVSDGAHVGSEYFGVVSHKLRQKTEFTKRAWRNIPEIANLSDGVFTPESFEAILNMKNPDAMSFQRHSSHDPISFANKFHPNFSKYFAHIMKDIGYNWTPKVYKNVFYCNYFVAKEEIYDKYCKEMLLPAMSVMEAMPELMANSMYPNRLPEHLVDSFGVPYYPYHTFLCERMFSYFADLHNLKCEHY